MMVRWCLRIGYVFVGLLIQLKFDAMNLDCGVLGFGFVNVWNAGSGDFMLVTVVGGDCLLPLNFVCLFVCLCCVVYLWFLRVFADLFVWFV